MLGFFRSCAIVYKRLKTGKEAIFRTLTTVPSIRGIRMQLECRNLLHSIYEGSVWKHMINSTFNILLEISSSFTESQVKARIIY
jgi:hypothetical protein